MDNLLTLLLDIIFPRSPEEKTIASFSIDSVFTLYEPAHYKNIQFLSRYNHPVIKAAITRNKFHHDSKASVILGNLLRYHLRNRDNYILTPIPLGRTRERERGYNQVVKIINSVSLDERTVPLLKRKAETKPQTSLSKTNRLNNMKDVFATVNLTQIPPSADKIIIVDDVVTTGATLIAALKTLRQSVPPQIKVEGLAIAH